ncbi:MULTISPECIES: hypothetical protein [unclassified Flavobacterium]|uniref:hypothetical protein n=1 Tax=unclassified Flavobacterium TaxID=196869 RepID=UPI003F902C7D
MKKIENMQQQVIIGMLSHLSRQLIDVESKQDFILNLISQKFDIDIEKINTEIERITAENSILNLNSIENIYNNVEDINDFVRDIKFPLKDDESESM